MQDLALREDAGLLTVELADQNRDDLFSYVVQYAYLPPNEFAAIGSQLTTAVGSRVMNISAGSPPVVRGFAFTFWHGDNELRSLELDMSGDGTAEVDFSDQNPSGSGSWWSSPSDWYNADVDYGILGRSWMVSSPMVFSGVN